MHRAPKIKLGEWEFFDFPIEYSERDYNEARKEIIDKLSKIPEIVALFECGCITAPGISDMDFWAVFSDDAEKIYIPSKPVFSEKTRYLMAHRIFVISEKHYRKMLYLDPCTIHPWPNGHKLLYQRDNAKRDLNFEKINFGQERNAINAVYIEQMLGTVFSALYFYAKKQLPVRRILDSIKDCTYIIEEIEIITGKKIGNNFAQDFKNLRSNWFEINQKEAIEKLIEMLYRGLLIGFEAAFCLAEWLENHSCWVPVKDLKIRKTTFLNHSFLGKKAKNIYLNTPRNQRIFTDFVKTPEQALELSIRSCKEIKIMSKKNNFCIIFQPLAMASISLGIANESGILSDKLKKDIFTNQKKVPVLESSAFKEKIRILNESTQLYNKKLIISSDAKGFVFSTFYGFSFREEGIRRKIVSLWLKCRFWQLITSF